MLLPKTPHEVLTFAREHEVLAADLRFVDFCGQWRHVTVPLTRLTPAAFTEGFAVHGLGLNFAGASELSGLPNDLGLILDPGSAKLDPFAVDRTLVVQANLADAQLTAHPMCTRSVLQRALAHQRASAALEGIEVALTVEASVFDEVRVANHNARAFYSLDASAGAWNSDREELPNLGHKIAPSHGWGQVGPIDPLGELRHECMRVLSELGIALDHHEAGASTGQVRFGMRAQAPARQIDHLLWLRYVVKNLARRANKVATFMPAPLADEPGNGLCLRLMPGPSVKSLATYQKHFESFVAGVFAHWSALCSFALASTNSYRRLARSEWAPMLSWQTDSCDAGLRVIPSTNAPSILEFSAADLTGNPYLLLAAWIMAGLDGMRQGMSLAQVEQNREAFPRGLEGAVQALAADHEFLLAGDVFDRKLVQRWSQRKLQEAEQLARRPHPYEIERCFHV